MFINEAVTLALANGCCIKRTTHLWKPLKVMPTNSIEQCLLVIQAKPDAAEKRVPRWNPSAADLLADDWVIVP